MNDAPRTLARVSGTESGCMREWWHKCDVRAREACEAGAPEPRGTLALGKFQGPRWAVGPWCSWGA